MTTSSSATASLRLAVALRWPEILGFRAEDENAITERLTAPRVLFLGPWALLAPKKEAKSFLTVSLPEGGLTLAVLGTNVYALRQLVENIHRWTGVPILPSSPSARPGSDGVPSGSVPARLQQLQELLDAELISEAEYEQRREAILDSI